MRLVDPFYPNLSNRQHFDLDVFRLSKTGCRAGPDCDTRSSYSNRRQTQAPPSSPPPTHTLNTHALSLPPQHTPTTHAFSLCLSLFLSSPNTRTTHMHCLSLFRSLSPLPNTHAQLTCTLSYTRHARTHIRNEGSFAERVLFLGHP